MDPASSTPADRTDSKFQYLARAGYAAKGVLYGTVGLLALSALYGLFGEGRLTGARGALETIATQPFGQVLLALMAVGLAGYVLLRFAQAFTDAENKGSDASGLMQRAGFLASGLLYGLLALYAVQLGGWLGRSGGGSKRSEWTATLMSHEAGIALIGLIGATFAGVGVYQLYRAATRQFEKHWVGVGAAGRTSTFAVRFSQFGVAARGFTLMLIGGIIVDAALGADPEEARGLGHALTSLRGEAYGTVMLTLIGSGLLCYGLYCFINARYRRIQS
jgi:hypothetical protein